MTSGSNNNTAKYVSVLLQASTMYGNDSGSFALFDSTKYNGKDLLFKDSTIKLVDESRKTYKTWLGADYLMDLEALNDCPATTAPSTTAPGTTAPSTTAPSTTAPSTSAPSKTVPRITVPIASKSKDNKPDFLASVVFSLVGLALSGIAE